MIGRRKVKKILFVNETLLKIMNGQAYWLWLNYESSLHVCLMMFHLSKRERPTIFVYYQFFHEQIRTKFVNNHIYHTDGAYLHNDDDACKWLRLNQIYYLRSRSQEYHGKIHLTNQR